jgi:hypothetical protein
LNVSAVDEDRAGTHERDQLGRVDGSPPVLSRDDQLLEVVGDLRGRLPELRAEQLGERLRPVRK